MEQVSLSESREPPSPGELGVPRGPGALGSRLRGPREPMPTALGGASNGMHIHSDTHPAELWV